MERVLQPKPVMLSRLQVKPPSFGPAWVGVGVLTLIGMLAIRTGAKPPKQEQRR